jgi:hypothetical protein
VASLVLALSLSSFAGGLGAQVVTGVTGLSGGGSSFGAGAGIVYDIALGPVSIVPGALFMYRALGEETEGTAKVTFSEMGVDIPVLLRYNIAGSGVFAQVGPQVGFAFGADVEACVGSTCVSASEMGMKIEREPLEFGLTFGAGYSINDNVTVDARYYLGLTKYTADYDDKLYQILAGVSYKF